MDAHKDIALVNERFMALVRDGDRRDFARLYTEDAILMLPNMEALSGREGAMRFFDALKARQIARVQLTTLELEHFGDTAWERGSSVALLSDGTPASRGKYIVIWKRTKDGWQLHRDIMNADAPPPVPPR
jgi:uncharacterized protein (TIGR02246 family)